MTFRRRLSRRFNHIRRRFGAIGGRITSGPRGIYIYESRLTRPYRMGPLDCRHMVFTHCVFDGRASISFKPDQAYPVGAICQR